MNVSPSGSELLERGAELAGLADALDGARAGEGRVAIVSGPPGIGKSSLLAAAAERAAGMEVAVARGAELERELAFGVVRQLFERRLAAAPLRERQRLLSGAAILAAPLFRGDDEPGAVGGDTAPAGGRPLLQLLHGLHWLASNLAERAPLLISVDDVQWADVPSLRFLLYLARRVEELPLAILVALRPGESGAGSELAAQLASGPAAATILTPRPLTPEASARWVGERLPGADAGFRRACADAAGGNPLLLEQLVRALVDEGVEPREAEAGHVYEIAPEAASLALRARLERIGPAGSALARAVAVLGDAKPHEAAALAGLDAHAALGAAEALEAADILRSDGVLAFVHPLLRSALTAGMGATQRASDHLRAARLLADAGADPERVAAHLLAAPPQPAGGVEGGAGEVAEAGAEMADGGEPGWARATLERAAVAALERGAPGSAARYLARALEEPCAFRERAALLLRLGAAQRTAGDPAAAAESLRAAAELEPDAGRRARILLELAHTLAARGEHRRAAETCDRGLAELGDRGDGSLAAQLQAAYVSAARLDLATRPLAFERLPAVLERAAGEATPDERVLLAELAFERALAGEPREKAVELAGRALGDGALLREQGPDSTPLYMATTALSLADELALARGHLDAALAEARARGSVLAFATASHFRGWTLYRLGLLAEAMADAHSALDAVRYGWEFALPSVHALLAYALVDTGDLAGAERALELPSGEERWSESAFFVRILAARGRLRLLRGQVELALADFLSCGRREEAMRSPNPATIAWRSEAALAYTRLGARDEARALVGEEIERARRFGARGPLGVSLSRAGLVAGGEEGIELLREGVAVLERSAARLERARALTDLGAALRRAGRRTGAREPLREGLELAYRCGATALVRRARDELVAAGARPRRLVQRGADALTPSERRVATLAAQGLTNRRIAEELFVTVKAVEWHLRNAYRKLEIESRRELEGALAREAA